ncbi:MAG: rhodanese-like domain-containing protein [Terriglobia bacterium]
MAKHHSPRFLALVDDAKTRVHEMSVQQLKDRLGAGGFHLVDVREADEYAAGRIPGAIHLCKGIIERDVEVKFPDPNAEIVLYCGGGFRSALAADNLQKMGYTRVISLAGGWRGWTGAGFPVEK